MSLLSASPEVLRNIILHSLDARSCGPPHEWYSLVLCCQALRRQLDIPAIHTLLFAAKFHVPADVAALPAHAKSELARRFSALKLFRRGASCFDADDRLAAPSTFTDALWVAYAMLKAEEPCQLNVDQLLWAGLPDLLLIFLKTRLYVGAQTNHGWPLSNEINSLVIALMWLLSSQSAVKVESAATRDQVMERLRPYVLAAFRYPLSAHESYSSDLKTASNFDGPGGSACRSPPTRDLLYFGSKRTVRIPSTPIHAILCYFTRLDMLVPMFPEHLQSSVSPPSSSRTGPRPEDVEHFITECRTQFESWNPCPSFSRRNLDFLNSRRGYPAYQLYSLGSLTGRWRGSSIVPYVNEYRQWQTDAEAPESMNTFCRQPLYITLREHFYCSPEVESSSQSKSESENWLPTCWEEMEDGIAVFNESTDCKRFYQTHRGCGQLPENVVDVLVTGQTDDPYASAWGAFKIFGRVRLSDGFIFLQRESIVGLGTTVLRGYLSSPNNFAGRYRALNNCKDAGTGAAEWEAPFSLCKMQ